MCHRVKQLDASVEHQTVAEISLACRTTNGVRRRHVVVHPVQRRGRGCLLRLEVVEVLWGADGNFDSKVLIDNEEHQASNLGVIDSLLARTR